MGIIKESFFWKALFHFHGVFPAVIALTLLIWDDFSKMEWITYAAITPKQCLKITKFGAEM